MERGSPTLNLNEVEAQEVKEHMYAAGSKVAGATDPYVGEAPYAAGTATASAESGGGQGYGPLDTPASAGAPGPVETQAGDGHRDAGIGHFANSSHGLAKVKEGVKEALGLKK